ncbi:glycosyltransferase [uncultured Lacinutrix sp.]|uniref:glycosyltransferase n=1 Tax=uncultured Lacinutrix sp. TaxID=574032 RepID=UPI002622E48F|nr:glycosyltransferase [uncultured Lacinutrix sp.]
MENKNQHIVFLTPGFAESEADSTTIPALQVFLKSLRKTIPNASLTILAFQFPFSKKKYNWYGIEVIPLNGQNKRYKKLLVWEKAFRILQKMHKTKKIDAIHSFWIGECSQIGQRFSIKYNINHIITVMGQDASIKNLYAKKLVNSNAKIVSLSPNHQAKLLETHNLSSIIISWHIDTLNFPDLQDNTIDILGVGSLNTIKNYNNFIEIIYTITKTYKTLNIAIIGNGSLQKELQQKIKLLGLEHTITLLGELTRSEVLNTMAKSNILLHTSSFESFGFVFLEALYSGMHLVSYDVGIAKTSKKWTIGNDKSELIEACKNLLSLPNRQKKRVELNSESATINAYLNLYSA